MCKEGKSEWHFSQARNLRFYWIPYGIPYSMPWEPWGISWNYQLCRVVLAKGYSDSGRNGHKARQWSHWLHMVWNLILPPNAPPRPLSSRELSLHQHLCPSQRPHSYSHLEFISLLLMMINLLFWNRVSLCKTCWPWTHRNPPPSASQLLRLKFCAIIPGLWWLIMVARLE